MSELSELLEIAEFAAARAGAALRARKAEWSSIAADLGREVKIDADTRAEVMIVEALKKLAPYPIISEEAGMIPGQAGERVWAVDPLDGSVNYMKNYPHCAVSIALLENGSPIVGVVDAFLMGEVFAAAAGRGAHCNGRPMRPSDIDDRARGVLNTGIPARARTDERAMQALARDLMAWRKVRMIGSAALALAYVADGRAEAYRESGSMIWDVAGGCALVLAAGGVVSLSDGAWDTPREVAAANGRVAFEG